MSKPNYHIGLDIGTSSIGFAVTDDHAKLIHKKGKTIIGARLFKEGVTAADRRTFRTARRRLKRRKWRLHLLNTIFADELDKVDPNFLRRLKESNLVPQDHNRHFEGTILFPQGGDQDFYEKYPTIYHLRHALMHEHRKFDLRMIYLAMHHIIKYRGNFLNSTPVDQFKNQSGTVQAALTSLNDCYQNRFGINVLNLTHVKQVEQTWLDRQMKSSNKQKRVAQLLNHPEKDKTLNKLITDITKEISRAVIGYSVDLNKLLNLQVDKTDKARLKSLKVNLSDEDIDDTIAQLSSGFDDNQFTILNLVRKLFAEVTLNQIVPSGMSLSESMIQKYDEHKQHLKLYKRLIDNLSDRKKARKLDDLYTQYIKNKFGVKRINQDDFYKQVKKQLDDSSLAKQIQTLIEQERFMPKQRMAGNGVIPHQLHQVELDQIIENQRQYYPWLAELNPNEHRRKVAKYKLDELVAFHIPYYVGPLITAEDQQNTSGKKFAWMKRKADGQITPWNFDDKVDRMASADRFIKRMTTQDTYLLGEPVLPDESILYQKFKVLNELNMLKVNGDRIKVATKQQLFNDLFKQQKTISVKKLQTYLFQHKYTVSKNVPISGLSDPKKFSNTLGTYVDFRAIFGNQVDNPDLQTTFEQIIEWSTVFEDRDIYEAKLKQVKWLTDDQIEALVNKRYRGWGQLSCKLLTGIKNDNGERIIDALWNTNQNFMQIQAQPDFQNQIEELNQNQLSESQSWDDILQDTYTSPQNKKAIRQVMQVVSDIKTAMGYDPTSIAIEFTRGPKDHPQRTVSRYNQISNIYKKLAKEINADLQQRLDQYAGKDINDKLFLYFTQLGRDIYSGEELNIDKLDDYDIDHILPQSFIKDDSLDNRVLTTRKHNNEKADRVPNPLFGKKMGTFWRKLMNQGLISKYKLKNLTLNPDRIGKYTANGFIRRQLVETSQVIKLVANFLGEQYSDSKIIEITAKMNSQVRARKTFIKNRFINDYHHGFDAYLTVFNALYLYERFPKLHSYFVYGENQTLKDNQVKLKRFNFLYDVLMPAQQLDRGINNRDYYPVVAKYREILQNDVTKAYGYKFMLTTHEVYTNQGPLFNRTNYPSPVHDTVKRKQLIPLKKNKPVAEYGGYSGNKDAYLVIVRIKHSKEDDYQVLGVKRRWLDELKTLRQQDRKQYLQQLHTKLAPQLIKRGKIPQFTIIWDHVMLRQLIIDGKNAFTLGSAAYKYNNRQLILSLPTIKTLDYDYMKRRYKGQKNFSVILSKRYDEAYEEIRDKIYGYFSLYNSDKISNAYDKFKQLPNFDQFNDRGKKLQSGKLETLQEILNSLHANSMIGHLNAIDAGTSFGQFQEKSGIKLSPNAQIVFQSPTGLFERKVTLKDLKDL